jgi:hypothetical protein
MLVELGNSKLTTIQPGIARAGEKKDGITSVGKNKARDVPKLW